MIRVIGGSNRAHSVDYGRCDWFLAVRHGIPAFHLVENTINGGCTCAALVKRGVREVEAFGEVAGSRHVPFSSRFFDGHTFDCVALGKGKDEKGNDHVTIRLADGRQLRS